MNRCAALVAIATAVLVIPLLFVIKIAVESFTGFTYTIHFELLPFTLPIVAYIVYRTVNK